MCPIFVESFHYRQMKVLFHLDFLYSKNDAVRRSNDLVFGWIVFRSRPKVFTVFWGKNWSLSCLSLDAETASILRTPNWLWIRYQSSVSRPLTVSVMKFQFHVKITSNQQFDQDSHCFRWSLWPYQCRHPTILEESWECAWFDEIFIRFWQNISWMLQATME